MHETFKGILNSLKEWAFWASFYDTSAAAGRQPLAVLFFEQLTFRPTIDSYWPAHPSRTRISYAAVRYGGTARVARGDCQYAMAVGFSPGGPLIWGDCLSRDSPTG